MIKVNNDIIKLNNYPDGTLLVKYWKCINNVIKITWNYESDNELFALICITRHLKSSNNHISLTMPYIPHGRMDRVKSTEDVFTLKYFANIINYLGFESVTVLDPHSPVSEALINNIVIKSPKEYIGKAIEYTEKCNSELILYFPDASAAKRYSEMFPRYKYCYGNKKRDFKSGKILGLDIVNKFGVDLNEKTILMVDDICSFGGTMTYGAKALKEFGVEKIYAYATHTENSLLDREKGTLIKALEDGIVEKLFTTNSLFTGEHEKVTVMRI